MQSNFPQQPPNPNMQQQQPNNFPQQQQLNPNAPQQSSFSNFQQQQLNPNAPQQSSFSNFQQQQLNPNAPQQSSFSNLQQQQLNPNCSQQSSYSNLPQPQQLNRTASQQSSYSNFLQQQFNQNPNVSQQQQQQQNQRNSQLPPTPNKPPAKRFLKTQSFKVVYNGSNYIVDPISLCKSSPKFKELIQPYIQDYEHMRSLYLEINNVQFSKRNVNNFLRLCQKLPTDVQNSEMKEICEIAKMFQADDIYNTGLQFIQNNLDQNFFVLDNKYDGPFLTIAGQSNNIPINQEMSESFVSDNGNNSNQGNYYMINDTNNNENSANQATTNASLPAEKANQPPPRQTESRINLDDHSALHDPVFSLDKALEKEDDNNTQNTKEENKSESNKPILDENGEPMHSVVYQVRVENHTFKCPIFKFVSDKHLVFTAKQKFNDTYVGEGGEIHISKKANHVAHIHQSSSTLAPSNTINVRGTQFDLKYVSSGSPNHNSLEVSFPLKDSIVKWIPRPPKYDPTNDMFYLNFHGEYHHTPILSSKNIVLQNEKEQPTFIVRKMDQNIYEIECLPIVDPLYAFCIGLSEIIGPYSDPYANVDYYD